MGAASGAPQIVIQMRDAFNRHPAKDDPGKDA
jgi:hypothetical protein